MLRDGEKITVHQSEVVADDLILLRSGDSIVVDGSVVRGELTVDESQLTGEADAVHKY